MIRAGGALRSIAALFALAAPATAGDLSLGWNAPTTGSTPTGYRLHLGPSSGQYTTLPNIDVGNVLSYILRGVPSGTHYIAATAYNAVGSSDYSNEISAQVAADSGGGTKTDLPAAEVSGAARVLTVTPDATGATVTIEPGATALQYQDDTTAHAWVPILFPAQATVFRHARTWTTGHTFVCYRTHGTDGLWTEQQCNTLVGIAPVAPPPPPSPPPPASPPPPPASPPPPPPPPMDPIEVRLTAAESTITVMESRLASIVAQQAELLGSLTDLAARLDRTGDTALRTAILQAITTACSRSCSGTTLAKELRRLVEGLPQ
ncbi:MAG: fibronectin type III domain-containing protein [Nitrospiraceae bacterium]